MPTLKWKCYSPSVPSLLTFTRNLDDRFDIPGSDVLRVKWGHPLLCNLLGEDREYNCN